ncbi:dihydropteroate synthase [Vibrio algivorus]|uniref:Dihydropteroate synthase n=1 Tax=Vibrio algivorus TaxID=1667024 RepID=A0A557PHC2_9VIBR|nr:dihydropteroate synthase [Vibrio algivorus]TVO40050.1 dihydropteroate synthase [Vibrio algivorus]
MKLISNHKQLDLSRPQIMGILNATPDSFSDGGKFHQLDKALLQVDAMIEAGVSIIDIGGESTRPGAKEVTLEDELSRVIPLVKAIRQKSDVWISIDTSKAEVMKQSIECGADIINDVRSLRLSGALDVVAKANVPVCIMHMQGEPKTMQDNPEYQDVLQDVDDFLTQRIEQCITAGIKRENIIIDPGFGFGKTLEHNYRLLANLEHFHQYKLPILAGMSRKSMVSKALGKPTSECVIGSVVCATLAAQQGAQIIRVHDVQETQDAMRILEMIQTNR